MREILFKAKRLDNGEWVEGMPIFDGTDEQWRIVMQLDYSTGTCIQTEYAPRVIAKTICQYTGLTDKNGRKIWENDIVKTYNSKGEECYIERIVWAGYSLNEGWCSGGIRSLIKYDKRVFNTGFGKSDARKCEVIGNVFDNPELLEKAR